MALLENIPDTLRNVFDYGLDEVLIFAVVFIFILLSGRESKSIDEYGDSMGILPLLIIGVFLLLFSSFGRAKESTV